MRLRTIPLALFGMFVIYAIVTSPTTSAGLVHIGFGYAADGLKSLFAFFDTILSGGV